MKALKIALCFIPFFLIALILGSGCAGLPSSQITSGSTTATTTTTGTTSTSTSTTSTSTTGTTGSTSTTLNAHMTINGGLLSAALSAGTQSFTLTDYTSHVTQFNNIYVPIAIPQSSATVIRAGSLFINGTYTGTTAQYTDNSNNTSTIPLNANGTLAKDIAVGSGCKIVLPISAIGPFTFTNGVTIYPDATQITVNTTDITVSLTTSSITVPTGTTNEGFTGTTSFTGGGDANTTITVGVGFANSIQVGLSGSTTLAYNVTNAPPVDNVTASGNVSGNSLPFTTASITYNLSG